MNDAQGRDKGRNILGLSYRNKYLIITSLVICVIAASVYLLFLSPKYKVRTEVAVSDDWQLPIIAINELRSESTIAKAVNALGFQISYYHKGAFTTTELYGDSLPIKFILGKGSSYASPVEITINLINGSVCRIDQNNVLTDVPLYHPVEYGFLNYTIIKGPAFKPIQPPLTVKLTPTANLIENFSKSLAAKVLSSNSFELNLDADNAQKGQDFLNKLVEVINAQYAKPASPAQPTAINRSLLAKLIDSIAYYKVLADNYREQQDILNNIKKPRRLPKPKTKPVLAPVTVTVQTALTEKERTDLNTLNSIKSYALKPNDAFVIIPDNYQGGDNRIGALIQDFNKAQLNKQRVQQDSDNADASVYAFKLEINSVKDALVSSITQKEQKIRDAHQVRVTHQPKVVEQPKDAAPADDIESPEDVGPPKNSKSIASFIALQLNDSIAQINAIIKSKRQQYNRLLYGAGAQNTGPQLTITYKSNMRESMISKSFFVYIFAFLAGLLLPILLIIINEYMTSVKKWWHNRSREKHYT